MRAPRHGPQIRTRSLVLVCLVSSLACLSFEALVSLLLGDAAGGHDDGPGDAHTHSPLTSSRVHLGNIALVYWTPALYAVVSDYWPRLQLLAQRALGLPVRLPLPPPSPRSEAGWSPALSQLAGWGWAAASPMRSLLGMRSPGEEAAARQPPSAQQGSPRPRAPAPSAMYQTPRHICSMLLRGKVRESEGGGGEGREETRGQGVQHGAVGSGGIARRVALGFTLRVAMHDLLFWASILASG